MKYNPNNILIDSLKAEGLHIVDKRGIKFDDEAERNMIWEGELMVDRYREYLWDMDVDWWYIWPESFQQDIRDFRRKIGA
jgi:hypothetical protein